MIHESLTDPLEMPPQGYSEILQMPGGSNAGAQQMSGRMNGAT
jgi:hypothetical protein